MKVKIASVLEYAGRLIALVDVSMNGTPYRTSFYQSSGSNVDGKGKWFPTAGIVADNPLGAKTGSMPTGWISKDLLIGSQHRTMIIPTVEMTESQHADPKQRLAAFNYSKELPFDVEELSEAIGMEYKNSPLSPVARLSHRAGAARLGFVNRWLNEGMNSVLINPNKEPSPHPSNAAVAQAKELIRDILHEFGDKPRITLGVERVAELALLLAGGNGLSYPEIVSLLNDNNPAAGVSSSAKPS